jgi:hypothetical protein
MASQVAARAGKCFAEVANRRQDMLLMNSSSQADVTKGRLHLVDARILWGVGTLPFTQPPAWFTNQPTGRLTSLAF